MIADAGSPGASRIVLVRIPARIIQPGIDLGDDFPVHQVGRFQHLHAHEMEIRCHHVIPVTDTDGVGVGIIGQKNWVAVIAVFRVSPGGLGPVVSGKALNGKDQAGVRDIAFRGSRKAHLGYHGTGEREFVPFHFYAGGDVLRLTSGQILRQHLYFSKGIRVAERQAFISAENAHGRLQGRDFNLHRHLLQNIFAAQGTAHRSHGDSATRVPAGQDEGTRRVPGPYLRERHVPAHPGGSGNPDGIAYLVPNPTFVIGINPAVFQDEGIHREGGSVGSEGKGNPVPAHSADHFVQAAFEVAAAFGEADIGPAGREGARKGMAHDADGAAQARGDVRFVLAVDDSQGRSLRSISEILGHAVYRNRLGGNVFHIIGAVGVAEADEFRIHGVLDNQVGSIFPAPLRELFSPRPASRVLAPVHFPVTDSRFLRFPKPLWPVNAVRNLRGSTGLLGANPASEALPAQGGEAAGERFQALCRLSLEGREACSVQPHGSEIRIITPLIPIPRDVPGVVQDQEEVFPDSRIEGSPALIGTVREKVFLHHLGAVFHGAVLVGPVALEVPGAKVIGSLGRGFRNQIVPLRFRGAAGEKRQADKQG